MGKPEYDADERLRMQLIGGGSIELRGKLAGDAVAFVAENTLVNLHRPGHHVQGVFGIEIESTPQTSLPLDGEQRERSKTTSLATILANIAPAPSDLTLIRQAVQTQTILGVSYDDDLAMYQVDLGKAGDKPKFRLEFVSGRIVPVKPELKKQPTGPTDVKVCQAIPEYIDAIHLQMVREKPGHYNNTLILLLLEMGGDDLDRADFYGRHIDRWFHLHQNGCDNKELRTHLAEVFGGTKGRFQRIGDLTHQLIGKKGAPAIILCHNLADVDLPKWVKPADRELSFKSAKTPTGNPFIAVRELLLIPEPMKKGQS